MGTIIAVVAVLEIHMDKKELMIMMLSSIPTKDECKHCSILMAMRLWRPEFSKPTAMANPPMKSIEVELK